MYCKLSRVKEYAQLNQLFPIQIHTSDSNSKNNSSSRGVLITILSSISLVLEPSGKWNLVKLFKFYPPKSNSFAAKLVIGQGSSHKKFNLSKIETVEPMYKFSIIF